MNDDKNQNGFDQDTFGVMGDFSGELKHAENIEKVEVSNDLDGGAAEELKEQKGEEKEIYTSDWISGYVVPNSGSVDAMSVKRQSRALEICALVFGILSIVACCCYGLFGIVGIILAIVALVKGKKSGMTIAGLICSVLGLLLSIGMLLIGMSEFSKEMQDAFMEGFNEGLEREYSDYSTETNDTYNDVVEEFEAAFDTEQGANSIPDVEAGTITIDGKTFTLPCKMSEFLAVYEVSEFSEEDMKQEMEPNDTAYIAFAGDGVDNGVSVSVENDTDATITDIAEAMVYSISVSGGAEGFVSEANVMNGISLGMTTAELETALGDLKYETSEMSGYVFYSVLAGEEDSYTVSIMLEEDKVICIDIYYSSY